MSKYLPYSKEAKRRYVSHQLLKDNAIYISLEGTEDVIKYYLRINKVSRMENPDGEPMKNPDGTINYEVQAQTGFVVLTKTEYLTDKQAGKV